MIQCALNVAVQLVQEWIQSVHAFIFFFFLLTGLLCTQEVKIYWVTSLQTLNLSFFKTHFFWDFSNQAQHADQKSPFTGFLPSHAFWAAQEAAKPVNNNNNKDINSVRYIYNGNEKTKQQTWKWKLTCGTEDLGEAESQVCADEWFWLEEILQVADGCELENKPWIYSFWFLLFLKN